MLQVHASLYEIFGLYNYYCDYEIAQISFVALSVEPSINSFVQKRFDSF